MRYSRGLHRLGQQRPAEALVSLAEAQRLQSQLLAPDPLAVSARALEAQTLAGLGDAAAARTLLESASGPEREFAETRIALAAIHLAERDPRGALDVLAPVLAGEAPVIADFAIPNALIVDAVARDLIGESRAAEDDVERALDLAEPDALVLPFLLTPARELLERHPRHRTAHAALLRASSTSSPGPRCGRVAAGRRSSPKTSPRARFASFATCPATCRPPRSRPKCSCPRAR